AHRLGIVAQAIAAFVLVPTEWLGDDGDASQPLDIGHAIPAGNDQPQRKAVLRRQRMTVDGVGEEDVLIERVGDTQVALVVLLDAALDAVVETGEDDLLRSLERPRLL